ncbi:unnamed protein product, partial [Prorocentrum cordatum]
GAGGLAAGAIAALLLALMWSKGVAPLQECALIWPSLPPQATDPEVAALAQRFDARVRDAAHLSVSRRGELRRDRDTTLWALLADHFGSNPSTPYMFNVLPLWGFLLPSPIYHIRRRVPVPFSSLGDSVNSFNIKASADGLFAHVVTGNQWTYALVREALVGSGLPEGAINVVALPAAFGLWDFWTHFETVLRIFRFENETDGDAYLRSHPPVFYVRAEHSNTSLLPHDGYKSRAHPDNVREPQLEAGFSAHCSAVLSAVGQVYGQEVSSLPPLEFRPLHIVGLDCLRLGTECLGDCPDASYFGPNILEDSDDIEMVSLPTDDDLHVVTMVNHRALRAAIYGSIAILKSTSPSARTLSKTHMAVRATTIGITSLEWPDAGTFVSWAFTRNPRHCSDLLRASAVHGCSIVEDSQVVRGAYFTYCERIYLNPVTGTGPNHADILPARLYHINVRYVSPSSSARSAALFRRIRLPDAEPLATFDGGEPLRAHVLSQFSHCHDAHHGSWARAASDVPLYLAELVLRGAERACGDSCAQGSSDWKGALEELMATGTGLGRPAGKVRVISLENTQAHALTCSKARGSFGHHFKVLDGGDSLHPPLDEALASMRRFEWIGLTDLFEPSLCLLHFQANRTLPESCDCASPSRNGRTTLGHWVETRYTPRGAASLSAATLQQIDAHTAVDARVFAAALRLLLGRLRAVEDATGASVLQCIDRWSAS